MHILFVNQFFWPDEAPTGRLLEDVCRELAVRGHEVSVICGPSQYRGRTARDQPPVSVLRIPALRFSRGRLARVISWLSFLIVAGLRALFARKPDVVVAMTTPPALSLALVPVQFLRGAKLWIWEMDVYPDVAVAGGIISEHSFTTRCLGAAMDWSRRMADGTIALGQCMKERLTIRGVPPDRVHVHENWAEVGGIPPLQFEPGSQLRVLYSGNFGLAHDSKTIEEVIVGLAEHPSIHFVFAGMGLRRAQLEHFCQTKGLTNVTFLPHLDLEAFRERLTDCHVGLVTLGTQSCGAVVPSKLYTLLAAGRPVLYIGPRDATPSVRIRAQNCGWTFDLDNVVGVSELLKRLVREPEHLQRAAANALAAHRTDLAREVAAPRLAARFAQAFQDSPAAVTPRAMELEG